MRIVPVDLGGRSYDVRIGAGALSASRELLRSLTEKPSAIVADAAVLEIHRETLTSALPALPIIEVASGEGSKSWSEYQRVSEALLAAGVERGGAVVAFGGGVIGDLTGFCAATLRRGCGFVQIPTTLLSQVDSSVGGKTAINTASGKNLVGAFHQPSVVIIDTDMLQTLPHRELLAGYAEVVKTAALGDTSFFSWLEERGEDVIAGDPEAREEAIARSCAAKAAIVSEDERETGKRALLNLGHTFGHALEAEAGYDGRLLHGEAVALGMAMAARFSVVRGLVSDDEASRIIAVIAASGLPTQMSDIGWLETSPDALLGHMRQDKKVESGQLTLILLRAVGEAFIAKDEDAASLLAFLRDETHL
ncbi:MAG: 3-dehydroquinate synthase [Pseudomonadota bacterium]